MKTIITILALATVAFGAPVACVNGVLDNGNPTTSIYTNGCVLGDKEFTNWSLLGPSPTGVSVTFHQTGDEYHIILTNGVGVPQSAFTSALLWDFTLSVTDPTMKVAALKDQAFFAIGTGTNGVLVGDAKSVGGCAPSANVTSDCLFTMTPGNETAGPSALLSWTSSITSHVGFNAGPFNDGRLNSIELAFAQAVPEPATFALVGGALIALGIKRFGGGKRRAI